MSCLVVRRGPRRHQRRSRDDETAMRNDSSVGTPASNCRRAAIATTISVKQMIQYDHIWPSTLDGSALLDYDIALHRPKFHGLWSADCSFWAFASLVASSSFNRLDCISAGAGVTVMWQIEDGSKPRPGSIAWIDPCHESSNVMYLFIPASSKGCCLNPKGWCTGTPYHPFSTPWKIQISINIISKNHHDDSRQTFIKNIPPPTASCFPSASKSTVFTYNIGHVVWGDCKQAITPVDTSSGIPQLIDGYGSWMEYVTMWPPKKTS